MEHNDQVQNEPLAGDSGELKKDSSEEEHSVDQPSEKKEENITGLTENKEIVSEVEEKSVSVTPGVDAVPPDTEPPPDKEPSAVSEPVSSEEPVSTEERYPLKNRYPQKNRSLQKNRYLMPNLVF